MTPCVAIEETNKYDLWQKQYSFDEKSKKNLFKIIKNLWLKGVVLEDISLN